MLRFEKHSDGRFRASTKEGLFTSKVKPTPDMEWEESDVKTANGDPVFVPKTETIEVEVDSITVHKRKERKNSEVEIEWN